METREKDGFVFHYNREDRLKTLSPEIKNRERHGFLKGNRSLIILFIDVILIIIIAFILYPLLIEFSSKAKIEDWMFKVKAFEYEDKLYTSLTVLRLNDKEENNLVKVIYNYNDKQIGEFDEAMPVNIKKKAVIRKIFDIDNTAESQRLKVKLIYGDIQKYMSLKIFPEK